MEGDELLIDGPFGQSDLERVRGQIAVRASMWRLKSELAEALALIATELLTNAIVHGDGEGRLRLWRNNAHVYCQVSDKGSGVAKAYKAGWERPSPESPQGGRGLWVTRTFSQAMTIDSSPIGTTVTVKLNLQRRA